MNHLTMNRRDFLKAGALLGGTLAAPRWVWSQQTSVRDVLVCIFQRGGVDGLNMIIPYGDTDYYRNRPTLAIAAPQAGNSAAALNLDGFFGLHPNLAPIQPYYAEGSLAVVHASGLTVDSRSHFDAQAYMESGTPGNKHTTTGWLGRYLASLGETNPSAFRAVGMGVATQPSLRGAPATAVDTFAEFALSSRLTDLTTYGNGLRNLHDGSLFLDVQSQQTFAALELLAAANPGQYPVANGATYPDTDFGTGLMQTAQLIKANLGLSVACVDLGGWDTHNNQAAELAPLLTELAQGLAAFAADLGGQMANVTVVTMSEFGRRVKENASGGTDHGHANAMLVMGGGVNGGRVYGTWPGLSAAALFQGLDLAVTTDYRTVLAELAATRLGNPALATVFPEFAYPGPLGLFEALG